jgi:hypothetical protein
MLKAKEKPWASPKPTRGGGPWTRSIIGITMPRLQTGLLGKLSTVDIMKYYIWEILQSSCQTFSGGIVWKHAGWTGVGSGSGQQRFLQGA